MTVTIDVLNIQLSESKRQPSMTNCIIIRGTAANFDYFMNRLVDANNRL